MLEMAALALLGAGFLAGLYDMLEDQPDSAPEEATWDQPLFDEETPDPDPVPAEDGADLVYTGDPVLTGTEGNDTLRADNPDHAGEGAGQVNLLGGDDVATIATPLGTTVDGGAGDDTLTSTDVGNTLIGGDGDDTLTGVNANSMSGGAGNDTISLDLTAELNDSVARIEGGEGDDTIAITAGAGQSNLDLGGAIVTGGAGADSFEITLQLDEEPLPADPGEVIDSGTAFRVDDFNPSEDRLQITIERTEGSAERDLVTTALSEVMVGDQSYYELELTFEASATAASAVTTIRIDSTETVTLDDIVIVSNNPGTV